MNKWSAHMLTGIGKLTGKMRTGGTCRTDEGGPACRRGETRGAWRVARFAVVAVMAMVFGLAGFVTNVDAALQVYHGLPENAGDCNSVIAAGSQALLTTNAGDAGLCTTGRAEWRPGTGTYNDVTVYTFVAPTAYGSNMAITGQNSGNTIYLRARDGNDVDYNIDLLECSDDDTCSSSTQLDTLAVTTNNETINQADLSALTGTVRSGYRIGFRLRVTSNGGQPNPRFADDTGGEASIFNVDETSACSPDPAPVISGSVNGDPVDICSVVADGTNTTTNYKVTEGSGPSPQSFGSAGAGYVDLTGSGVDYFGTTGTIEGWWYFNNIDGGTVNTGQRIFGQDTDSECRFATAGDLQCEFGGQTTNGQPAGGFQEQTWYYIAVTWNEGTNTFDIWVGTEVSAPTRVTNNTAWTGAVAGTGTGINVNLSPGNAAEIVDGNVSEIRMWNDVRTNGEITGNYTAGSMTGSEGGLLGLYEFNGDYTDKSGTGANGSAGGTGGGFSATIPSTEGGGSTTLYDGVGCSVPTGTWTDGSQDLEVTYTDSCGTTGQTTTGTFTFAACNETATVALGAISDPITGSITVSATLGGSGGSNLLVGDTDPPTQSSGWTYNPPASAEGPVTFYAQADGFCGPVKDSVTVNYDTLAPSVPSTVPVDAATGVVKDSTVTINFSEAIDCTTVDNSSVTISPAPTTWTRTSCSGSTAVFAPTGQPNSTLYTVTVDASIADLAGNNMAGNYVFSYTTDCTDSIASSIAFNGVTTASGDFDGASMVTSVDLTNLEFRVTGLVATPTPATTTYDYSAGVGADKWAYHDGGSHRPGTAGDPPASNTTFNGNELAAGDYTNIASNNGTDYTNTGSWRDANAVQMRINIAEDPTTVDSLVVSYDGSISTGTRTFRTYIWNFTTTSWQEFDNTMSVSTTESTRTATYDRTGLGFADFASSGQVDIVMVDDSSGMVTGPDWLVDYLKLDVNYTGSSDVETILYDWNSDLQLAMSGEAPSNAPLVNGNTYTLYARGDDAECGINVYYVGGGASPGTGQDFTWSSCTETKTLTLTPITDPITGTVSVTATGTAAGIQVGTNPAPSNASGWNYVPAQDDNTTTVSFYATGTGDCGTLTDSQLNVSTDTMAAPTVDAFVVPASVVDTAAPLDVPITTFTASDNLAVTGYIITIDDPVAPAAGAGGWTGTAPTSITVPGYATYTLRAYAKDAAGNVSAASSASVTMSNCSPIITDLDISATPNPINGPSPGTSTITLTPTGDTVTSAQWSDDGGSSWYASGTTYTAPSQTNSSVNITGRATEDTCSTVVSATNEPYALGFDTRTPYIEPGTATRAQSGVDKVKITMPYLGINDDSSASVSVAYDLNAAAKTPVTTDPITGAGPATINLGPFADGDAITNIVVTYADTRWGAAPGNAVQALADITIVAWFDDQMLHNSLRFACSVLDAGGKTITDSATCATEGGSWNEDRRYTGGWGTSGADDQYGAILCATCHEKASGNIKRITTTIGLAGVPGAAETISYTTAVDGTSDLTEAAGDHGSSNKVCEACHTYSATDTSVSTPTSGVRYHGYDMSGASVGNQNHYLGADCIKCHEHKMGFRASCNACHGNPPTDAGGLVTTDLTGSATWGKHDQHVNGQGYTDCDTCHTGWTVGGQMPNSGDLNIGFSLVPASPDNTNSVYDGRSAVPASYSFNGTSTWVTAGNAKTCANYCHGSTIGGNASAAVWLDTDTLNCGDCHGATAASPPANPASGTSHATHAGSGGQSLDCNFCHGSEYTAGTTTPAGHSDGSTRYNVANLAATYEWYSVADAPTYRGVSVGTDGGVVAPDSANYGNCSNVSCHWGTTTPTWNTGVATTCTTCHNDGSVTDPNDVIEAAPNTGAHTKHVESNANYVDCDSCHGAGAITGTHSGHINNATTITGVTGYVDVGGRGNYADTCGTACHQTATWNGVINWTGGITDNCLDCHSDRYHTDGNAGPQVVTGGVSGTASHVKYASADGTPSTEANWTTRCQQCHTKHSGTIVIPLPTDDALKTALGIDYFGHGQISLDPYSGSTNEAETCWNCHDVNTISEWGQNNNATTGGLAYDYGNMTSGGSSWYGEWNSARFSYKTGQIQSTHSASLAGSSVVSGGDYSNTESRDTVDKIRCSYCHDVHNTFAATGHADESGEPYLRGRWKGNPYNEDGAPRNGAAGSWTAATASQSGNINMGQVPRASASSSNSTTKGGYWIDQNSGDPNNTETYDSTGGLCQLCHGSNVDTLDVAAGEGNAGSEGLWVSGYNGHKNAVLDGSGRGTNASAESYARNIFTRTKRGSANMYNSQNQKNTAYVDMGVVNMTGTTDRGFSYRSSNSDALQLTPYITTTGDSTRPYGFNAFQWNDEWGNINISATTVALQVADGNTNNDANPDVEPANYNAQANYHTFNCGKCHNPHASRLPKLMITNCLDTKQNTWDNNSTEQFTAGSTPWDNSYASQWASAQNCHRLDDRAPGTTTRGIGWNRVTPW